MLDNREIAIIAWLTVFLAWVVSKPKLRKSLVGLLKAALAWKIVLTVGALLAYLALVVLGLRELGFWHLGNLKSTLIWLLTAALVMMFEVGSNPRKERYFQKALADGLKISVILEFVVNFYVLSLLLELLLIPSAALLACLLVVAESQEKYRSVRRLVNTIMALLGFGLLAYALYQTWTDIHSFLVVSTLIEFLLPIILTILFIPFLFLLAVWVSYESLFTRLQFLIADPSLRRFTKLHLIRRYGLNYRGLHRWAKRFVQNRPRSKEQILASLKRRNTEI